MPIVMAGQQNLRKRRHTAWILVTAAILLVILIAASFVQPLRFRAGAYELGVGAFWMADGDWEDWIYTGSLPTPAGTTWYCRIWRCQYRSWLEDRRIEGEYMVAH